MLSNLGFDLPGQFAGFLGRGFDPYVTGDPSLPSFSPPGLDLPRDVSPARFGRRRSLFHRVALLTESSLSADEAVGNLGEHYRKAFELLGSTAVRQAFDLTREREDVRERYGFDHTVEQRGLLAETLVVAMGEFGRTPRVGQITSDAGADRGGRDHWPHCYTVFFAGGGIAGGAIHGASDKHAAFPERDPVSPEDIAATIYAALGLDPATEITDPLARPLPIALGKPIEPLFA